MHLSMLMPICYGAVASMISHEQEEERRRRTLALEEAVDFIFVPTAPSPDDAQVMIQSSFDGIVIRGQVGSGGSATVLAATWHGSAVVLKRAKPDVPAEEMLLESQMPAKVGTHPSIVQLHGIVVNPPYMTAIILERMGLTLAQHRQFSRAAVENILLQMVLALQHLQKRFGLVSVHELK